MSPVQENTSVSTSDPGQTENRGATGIWVGMVIVAGYSGWLGWTWGADRARRKSWELRREDRIEDRIIELDRRLESHLVAHQPGAIARALE